jgi:hypothetical protein
MNLRKGILFESCEKKLSLSERTTKTNIYCFLFLIQKEDNFNNLFTFTFKIIKKYILKTSLLFIFYKNFYKFSCFNIKNLLGQNIKHFSPNKKHEH